LLLTRIPPCAACARTSSRTCANTKERGASRQAAKDGFKGRLHEKWGEFNNPEPNPDLQEGFIVSGAAILRCAPLVPAGCAPARQLRILCSRRQWRSGTEPGDGSGQGSAGPLSQPLHAPHQAGRRGSRSSCPSRLGWHTEWHSRNRLQTTGHKKRSLC
jgi:hypothetical protein